MENNELQHHGTKGMRWGIRRYQNPDGSLTAAGRKRYGVEGAKGSATKKSATTKKPEVATPKKKSVSEMSDAELKRAIDRAKLENDYRAAYPKHESSGKVFISKLISEAVVPAAISAGKDFLDRSFKKAINDKFGDKAADDVDALKKAYDKLDYKTKIDKLKNPEKYESWDDKKKRREYEDETARRKAEADAKAAAGVKDDPMYKRYNSVPDHDIYKNSSAGKSYVSNMSNDTPSRSTQALGQTYIAGYLPAPKDDD